LPPSASKTAAKAASGESSMVAIIAKHSGDSPLVVLTLPKRREGHQSPAAWMAATEELVRPLKRVIFVQESGHERIQFVQE